MHRLLLALVVVASVSGPARAACCHVRKLDPEFVPEAVRVCTDAGGACGSVLYEGPLPLGAAREVCSDGTTVVYQEWDASLASFGPITTAVCDDNDVEL